MTSARPAPPSAVGRRVVLWSGAGVLAAAAGVAAGVLLPAGSTTRDEPAPDVLVTAIDAEQQLIARYSAAPPAGLDDAVAQVRRDHEAHLQALQALRARYGSTPTAPSPSETTGDSRTTLHDAESAAARGAAARAAATTGELAALLASIAACETTHAKLLS